MSAISTNYRELAPSEVAQVAEECAQAWQDHSIPARQYELATKGELEKYRNGQPVAPFDALVRCMRQIPLKFTGSRSKLLDVGASSCYYRAVLRHAGYFMQYTGCDFSPAFKEFAENLHSGGIDFRIADARTLPFHDDSYDIVLTGATIMHVLEYPKVIAEVARVARHYAIFHRTPITDGQTKYYVKEAYGVPCLEIHFNEEELLGLFNDNGLTMLRFSVDVFREGSFGHRSYLLAKTEGLSHVQV